MLRPRQNTLTAGCTVSPGSFRRSLTASLKRLPMALPCLALGAFANDSAGTPQIAFFSEHEYDLYLVDPLNRTPREIDVGNFGDSRAAGRLRCD